MRRIVGLMALATIGAMAVSTTPAGAALDSYRSTAESTALHVTIAGRQLTLAAAGSEVDSGVHSVGSGAGDLLTLASQATAERTADGESAQGPNCSPLSLPPEVPLLDLATGCGTASASIASGMPSSSAKGEIASVGVGVVELDLDTVLDDAGLGALLDVLGGAGAVPGVDLGDTVADLVAALTNGGDALTVEVGPATTETTVDASSITASAHAATTIVNVLNRDLLQLPPVLRVEVLPADATVVRDRNTGAVIDQGATPAAVRIVVAPDIAALAGIPGTIEVGTADQLAALVGTGLFDGNGCLNLDGALPAPLDRLLCLTLPTVQTSTEGDAVRVEATALEVSALDSLVAAMGVPDGIDLRFANAVVEVEASAATEAPRNAPVTPAAPSAPTDTTLPRTGGELPLAAALGLALVAGFGIVVTRRSRAVPQ
jgi:LPXTG-motif cell wall-anchored protein